MTRYAKELHRELDAYLAFWAEVKADEEVVPYVPLVERVSAYHMRDTVQPHAHPDWDALREEAR